MDKQQNRSGGPHRPEGLANSSRNATKHGCCSRQVIVKGELQEDFDALEEWWFSNYDGEQARPLVEEAALNEWLLKRTQRNYLAVDARLAETDPNDWTEEQLHRLGLMLRYKTTAERSFHRSLAAVERWRRTRVYEAFAQQRADTQQEERERKRRQEEEENRAAEPTRAERLAKVPKEPKVPAVTQYVSVTEVEGKAMTKLKPTNEELLEQVAAMQEKPQRVFRKLTVRPKTLPEYAWMEVSLPGPTESREQVMQFEEWLRAIEREKEIPGGHIGPAEKDPSWRELTERLEEMEHAKETDGAKEEQAAQGSGDERRTEDRPGAVGGSSDSQWEDGDGTDSGERPAG